jgi:CRISPR system Cascade subunit CasD
MSSLILRLAAPLQSWGGYRLGLNKDSVAPTASLPRKSAISGLIGAATGSRDLRGIADSYELYVRVDKSGSLAEDYQVVSPLPAGAPTHHAERWLHLETAGRMKKMPKSRTDGTFETAISRKDYLAHAEFMIAVDSIHADEWASAFAAPKFMTFLGRMSCPPSFPFVLGVWDGGPADGLSSIPTINRATADPESVLGLSVVRGSYETHDVEAFSVRVPTVATRRQQLEWVKENLR